ncbi:MAG: T9SS type A sorting domain-containing protein [Bacteroidota bacterium]
MTLQRALAFLLLIVCHFSRAQVYSVEQSVGVTEDGSSLAFPWSGGLNSGQYSTMDVDMDGLEDLIVFDRSASKINVFKNVGGAYAPTFEYADQFPENLRNWILLRDYNCDGKKDLFVSDPLGIVVYQNISDAEGLKWRVFNERGPQSPLQTMGSSEPTNLQLNATDIPSITDVDGDGDLDILNFRFTRASTVQYHKNLSMENTGNCDSLQLERVAQEWGDFEQCFCAEIAFGGDDCGTSGGRTKHQGGKALLTLDMDNDGDQEAIVGEEDCDILNFLLNEGSASEALMNSSSISFPNAQNPIALFSFPAAYYEDVDFDGIADLLVAPNVPANIGFGVNFEQSSWFYKNLGSESNPDFQFIQRDFLQDQMLDFGENAVPAFYDYDADGDLDLFVSNNIDVNLGFIATLKLYENTGGAAQPSFKLKDRDFFNLSVLNFINIKPVFEDVDNNGSVDLVFSGTSLNTGNTSIVYFKNSVSSGLAPEPEPQVLYVISNGVSSENFKLFDIDTDGRNDLLIGRSTGRLEYYRNVGTAESPNFGLQDEEFLGFGVSAFTINTSVDIADLDADGNLDLITGDDRGNFNWISDFRSAIGSEAERQPLLFETSADQSQTSVNLGSRLVPRVVNLFNEDKPAIVVGTGQGGMNILRNTGAEVQPLPELISGIYPNPAVGRNTVLFRTTERTFGYIVSLNGQRLTEPQILEAETDNIIDISSLASGFYLLVTTMSGDDFTSFRFVVDR